MNESIDAGEDEPGFSEGDVPKTKEIPAEFYSRSTAQSHGVINNSDVESGIRGRSDWFRYSFDEPVFLRSIEVVVEGYKTWDYFHLKVQHVDGTEHDERIRVSENGIDLRLGKLATGFKFKPDPKLMANPRIISVKATGYTLSEFHKLEWDVRELSKSLQSLKTQKAELATKESQKATLEQSLKTLEQQVGRSTAQLDEINNNRDQATAQLESRTEDLKDVATKTRTAREELRELQADVDEKVREYDELVSDVRLFPSEIVGFVREGNRNIIWYVCIGAPFVIMLAVILGTMLSSAVDLTQLWRQEDNVDIWTIFLTRLPFVLLALALIEACAYVIARLIYEVMRINRQRLELAKLSIISKDVSVASNVSADLSNEDRYAEETKLRMSLLREHMANFAEQDFVYKGSAIMSAIVGAIQKRTERSKGEASDS